jgi:hypothetical protein
VLAGAGVVAAAAVAGAVGATGEPSNVVLPAFMFNNTTPAPGSTVSIASGRLTVLVNMLQVPAEPVDLLYIVEFRSATGTACVAMSGSYPGADRRELALVAPLTNLGSCGPTPIDTTTARIRIAIQELLAHDETVGFPFRFEP